MVAGVEIAHSISSSFKNGDRYLLDSSYVCGARNEFFAGAKRTVSDSRGRLQSETIEISECLESWFRLGVFTKEDLHAIVGTMEDGAMEALIEAYD